MRTSSRGRHRRGSTYGSASGRQVRPIAIDEDQVRALADLDRPDLGLEAERPGAVASRHPQRVAGGQRAGSVPHRLQRRRQPHLVEHVEAVVAGRAVGAERHARCRAPHVGDRRDAGSELQVRAGAVHHLDVALRQQRLLGVVTQTQCAAHSRRVARPVAARYSRLPRPPDSRRTTSTSSRDSDACVWTRMPPSLDESARRLRAARASTRRRSAARTRRAAGRPAAPCHRLCKRDALVDRLRGSARASRAGDLARPSPSCTCRPSARSPLGRASRRRRRCRAPSPSSGPSSCRAAAARLQRGAPRRAQRCRRVRGLHRPDAPPQPLEQRQVVGVAAEQRLAEMDVRLDEAGQQIPAAARRSRDRATRSVSGADRGDAPVATVTAPSTISRASFIVRMVALRISASCMARGCWRRGRCSAEASGGRV